MYIGTYMHVVNFFFYHTCMLASLYHDFQPKIMPKIKLTFETH